MTGKFAPKSALGKGLQRLRGIHDAIAKDAALPMPPIRIVPYYWVYPSADPTRGELGEGPVLGMAAPIQTKAQGRVHLGGCSTSIDVTMH